MSQKHQLLLNAVFHQLSYISVDEAIFDQAARELVAQLRLPEFLSSLRVKGADIWVKGAGNEDQPARGNDGTSEAGRSRRELLPPRRKALHGAERDLPADFAFGHVHRSKRAPGGWVARQMSRRREERAAMHAVGRSRLG